MRLSKTISALFLSFVILFASLTQANAKRLHAAIADWTGGIITCEVAVGILEREMGYKVKQTVFPSGTGLWEAIAAGELDFACESWPSYAEADDVMFNEDLIYDGKVVKSYKGDGTVDLLGTTGIIGMSDYWIPRYAAEKFGIKTWKDLNKHKKEFATIESGNKMAGWVYILYEVFSGEAGKAAAKSGSKALVTAFGAMRMIVTVGWAIYPLGYIFGYLTGGVDADSLNVVYNLADFINKIAFGLVIWAAAVSSGAGARSR